MTSTVKSDRRENPILNSSLDKPLRLRTNFAWTIVGQTVYSASQWGMLTVLAKMGSPEMVGQFSLGLAICAPIVMFTNMQLRVVQATDTGDEFHFEDYLGLRLIATLLALLAIVGIASFAGYQQETTLVILAIGLAKAFESVSDVVFGLLQNRERMDRIAISKVIKGLVSLSVLGALIGTTGRILPGVCGLAAAWLAVLLTYDLHSARRLASVRLRVHPDTSWQLLKLSLPLGFVTMLISLNTNVPRYFVEHYGGESALGYYSAISYLTVVGTTVVTALGQSATPRLAQYFAARNRYAFGKLLLRLIAIAAALGIAGVAVAALLGPIVLTVLYKPDYAEHAGILVWLMVGAGVGYVAAFLGYGMSAARYFRVQVPLFLIVVVATVASCFVLVPRWGLWGAALATLIGAALDLLGSAAVVAHSFRTLSSRSQGAKR